MPIRRTPTGDRKVSWAAMIFVAGFGLLVVFVCYWYLFPALQAVQVATPDEKKRLAAHARLVLAMILFMIVLVTLFAGAILSFRLSRSVFPHAAADAPSSPAADAGKARDHRIELKPAEES